MSEIEKVYKTKDGVSVTVEYDEEKNDWFFILNGQKRRKSGLVKAKEAIEDFADKNVIKRTKFTPFPALIVQNMPYRIGYAADDLFREVSVVGLEEDYAGSEQFNQVKTVWFEKNGKKQTILVGIEHNATYKLLLYDTEENRKAVEEFKEEWTRTNVELEELQRKINVLSSKGDRMKRDLIAKLNPILPMEDLEWCVMSEREAGRKNGK